MQIKLDGLSKEAILDEDKVNNGVWIHLDSAATDPVTGKSMPLYLRDSDGNAILSKPQRAKVRSYRCRAIKEAEAKRQKDGFVKIRLAKKKDRDDTIAESSILPEADRFGLLLVSLENFSAAGGVQDVSPEDGMAIHGMSQMDSIVQQIREAAYDDDNYLATESTAPGKGSASTSTTQTQQDQTEAQAEA